MLQQTTVRVVIPYFERFAQRFPSAAHLANAEEDEVLALWSGLGYYRRARNLHKAARHMVEQHGGCFPGTLDAALATPGVGRYTANAVLSIASGQPLPVVDGNVRRVLSRLFMLEGEAWARDTAYFDLADILLHRDRPGEWNEALMELGATVCTPRDPSCGTCPVRASCGASATGSVDRLPEPRARRASIAVTVAAALVERNGALLLARRAEGRLLSRMWELPQTGLESSGSPPNLEAEVRERYGLFISCGPLVVVAPHAITFRRIRLEGYRAHLNRPAPDDVELFGFFTPDELGRLPLSSMTRKLALGLTAGQLPLKL
jgi:A/G-specific adenine glycosylase